MAGRSLLALGRNGEALVFPSAWSLVNCSLGKHVLSLNAVADPEGVSYANDYSRFCREGRFEWHVPMATTFLLLDGMDVLLHIHLGRNCFHRPLFLKSLTRGRLIGRTTALTAVITLSCSGNYLPPPLAILNFSPSAITCLQFEVAGTKSLMHEGSIVMETILSSGQDYHIYSVTAWQRHIEKSPVRSPKF